MRQNKEFVSFFEENHEYFNEKNEQYISCTTIIGNYKEPFDEEYWSLYKAIERVVDRHDIRGFKSYKRFCGGYQFVNATWGANPFKTQEVFHEREVILKEWEINKNDACERGTAEHLKRENLINANISIKSATGVDLTVVQDPQSKENTIMNFDKYKDQNFVMTEALVHNDKYMIAGQVDYVEGEGGWLDIKDYKTNKKIDMTAYRNKTMMHPLRMTPDCHFGHYQMQMSLYGWMMEQEGYKVRSLELIHIPRGGGDDIKIPMEYRPDWVESMVHHYAKVQRYKS